MYKFMKIGRKRMKDNTDDYEGDKKKKKKN